LTTLCPQTRLVTMAAIARAESHRHAGRVRGVEPGRRGQDAGGGRSERPPAGRIVEG